MQEISGRIAEGAKLSGTAEAVGLYTDDTLEKPGI